MVSSGAWWCSLPWSLCPPVVVGPQLLQACWNGVLVLGLAGWEVWPQLLLACWCVGLASESRSHFGGVLVLTEVSHWVGWGSRYFGEASRVGWVEEGCSSGEYWGGAHGLTRLMNSGRNGNGLVGRRVWKKKCCLPLLLSLERVLPDFCPSSTSPETSQ